MTQCVSLSLFRFDRPLARAWAFVQMGAARWPLSRTPDIGFWKLCGSGVGEGFTPIPNTAVWAILATWPSHDIARERVTSAPVFTRFRKRADEDWTIFLETRSVRGEWSGKEPFQAETGSNDGPLAALTRATIRPRTALRFWGRAPDISKVIGTDPNVIFKIGVGEVPWLHQVTFSIWPDAQTMAGFARTGPHAEAIRAVRDEGWFSEELYARFALLSDMGSWDGRSPLRNLKGAA